MVSVILWFKSAHGNKTFLKVWVLAFVVLHGVGNSVVQKCSWKLYKTFLKVWVLVFVVLRDGGN